MQRLAVVALGGWCRPCTGDGRLALLVHYRSLADAEAGTSGRGTPSVDAKLRSTRASRCEPRVFLLLTWLLDSLMGGSLGSDCSQAFGRDLLRTELS